jgi:hypothetical protein
MSHAEKAIAHLKIAHENLLKAIEEFTQEMNDADSVSHNERANKADDIRADIRVNAHALKNDIYYLSSAFSKWYPDLSSQDSKDSSI